MQGGFVRRDAGGEWGSVVDGHLRWEGDERPIFAYSFSVFGGCDYAVVVGRTGFQFGDRGLCGYQPFDAADFHFAGAPYSIVVPYWK